MKTKVVIVFNEKEFSIEVGELSSEQKKEFGERINTERAKCVAYDEALAKFNDYNDQYNINKELLRDAEMPLSEKVKMLWEQKTLLFELRLLRADVETKAKAPVDFEIIAKEQFEFVISGDGKASLIKEMESVGKTYRDILNIILPKVAEEKEKK